MDKLRMQSTNGVQENIEKIQSLFPDCVTETIDERTGKLVRKVDFEKLQQNLSDVIISGREERYQFTWPDKKKAILLANSPVNAALRPCREESVDFDNTQNLYIEGDNLDVLKCLKETYLHKVKMIYIDPPYNTGNDFVYEDDFAESSTEYLANSGQFDEQGNRLVTNTESNGRFHTDWLNMIYPRLKVARDLLSKDGAIFVTLDDHEIINARKIMDEIFGEESFIATIIWENFYGRSNAAAISPAHNYILIYSKMGDDWKNIRNLLPRDEKSTEKYQNPDNDIRGPWRLGPIFASGERHEGLMYTIETPSGKRISPPKGSHWRMLEKDFWEMYKDGRIMFGMNGTGSPAIKLFLKDVQNGMVPRSIWPYSEVGHTQDAKREIQLLFPTEMPFDTPKPSKLIKQIIQIACNKNDIILDFFSGSATTADAVMQLNAIDNGNRRFIMVQIPESVDNKYGNLCEVGKERIRRAGKKIKTDSPLTTQDLDTGFRVLKLDSSNMKEVYYTPAKIVQGELFEQVDNVKSDRTAEDLLFQVMLELGATLDSKIITMRNEELGMRNCEREYTVYNVADGYLVACFDKDVTDEVVTTIAKMHPLYAVLRDTSMANDSTATNFEQLFKTYSPDTVTKIL